MNDPETDAIAVLKTGDIGGLEALVRLYQVRALRTAYTITGDQHAAEDVVADAFLAVHDHIDQFDARQPFAPTDFEQSRRHLCARRTISRAASALTW